MTLPSITHRMTAADLRQALGELGVTAIDLAACLDVHPDTIGLWLRGESPVPGPAAVSLLAIFGATARRRRR